MKRLVDMLRYRRPAWSASEERWIERFIDPLPGCFADEIGNRHVEVGESRTIFSCHTDTVHPNEQMQKVFYDKNLKVIYGDGTSCLGADCAAGAWLMIRMIERGIPGRYIFHRAEERGGKGSDFIADNMSDLLALYDRAVAFDRMDRHSVITHQFTGRCCSEGFAAALCAQLDMKPDNTGSFTDTANYVAHVPECTNVSVGYFKQHTKTESLDPAFLVVLLDKVCRVNWEDLPVIRVAEDPWVPSYRHGGARRLFYGTDDRRAWANGTYYPAINAAPLVQDDLPLDDIVDPYGDGDQALAATVPLDTLIDWGLYDLIYDRCVDAPDEIADYLMELRERKRAS